MRWATNIDTEEICRSYYSESTLDCVPIRKLLIANIPQEATYKELKELLSVGKVEDLILKRKKPGLKNYAFVTYKNVEDAVMVRSRKYFMLKNQYLRVLPAYSWSQPDSPDKLKFQKVKPYAEEKNRLKFVYNSDPTMSNKTIECLNGDCLENIFRFLPILDRVRVERVCKRWQEAALRSWFFFKRLDLNPTNWYHNTERKTTPKISTPDIYQVLRRCGQYLVEVDLSKKCKSSLLGSGAVTIVAKCCPNVQSINLSGLNISLSALNALLKNSNNLKEFIMTDHTITGSEIKNGAATVLTKLFLKNKVKNVAISSQLISDNILFTKNSSAYIERLVVTKYTNGHRKLDKVIGNMNKLKALKVCLLPTRDQGTPSFLSMIKSPELKELELCVEPDESCFGKALVISENTNRVSKSLFSITKFDNLIRLNLPNIIRVNDTFLSVAVAYCRKLEFININFCRNVKDQSIVAFSSLSRLRSLECEDCEIHDTSLIQLLNSCPYLGTLNISHCKLITSELVVAAKEAVLNRNNSITLTLSAHKTAILKVSESVPLLKILC